MSDKLLNVRIRDTKKILFEGSVDRITAFNEVGPFDVYPMHANFISIIRKELVLYNKNKKLQEFKFDQAIMKVKKDIAHIFLGIEGFILDEKTASSPTAKKN